MKIRALSVVKLSDGKLNLTITYKKGASLLAVFEDILPMLIHQIGKDKLKQLIDNSN